MLWDLGMDKYIANVPGVAKEGQQQSTKKWRKRGHQNAPEMSWQTVIPRS